MWNFSGNLDLLSGRFQFKRSGNPLSTFSNDQKFIIISTYINTYEPIFLISDEETRRNASECGWAEEKY